MTRDDAPIPAAPTPRTPGQRARIWGSSALRMPCPYWHYANDRPTPCTRDAGHETSADLATLLHRDATGADDGPWYATSLARTVEALLTPDARTLPWVDVEGIDREIAEVRQAMLLREEADLFQSGSWR